MQDKDTTKSTFFQLFEPIYDDNFLNFLGNLEVDKYVKKLTTPQLIEIIALAQIEQYRGLRDISNSLNQNELSQAIDLNSISASQISRRLRCIPPEVIQQLFKAVKIEAGKKLGFHNLPQKLGGINLIDSSTISLCLSRYPWAEFRKTKAGVKLHLRLKFHKDGVIPDKAVITPARPSDKTQMDALVIEENDALNVFDRGYMDYKKFDYYCENGTRFVSRLKSNALVEVVKELSASPGNKIKKDCIIFLGAKGSTRMRHPLRLLEVEDTQGKTVSIITNDFLLSSEQISDIYLHRWQIELFFKWVKQHLWIKHFYGLSQEAVENQLFIALITYSLLMMLKLKVSYTGTLLTIKRLLQTCLYEPFTCFVQKLYRVPRYSLRCRKNLNHDLIYNETLKQVNDGEGDYLNDLSYDPIIL